MKYTTIEVPIGSIVLLAEGRLLRQVLMTGRDPEQACRWIGKLNPNAELDGRLLARLQKQIRDYFSGKRVEFEADFDISDMTPFQQLVLKACARLGYGRTVTYGELAGKIGYPKASRAVGAALGRNPIPLVIPCHRVIGCNGTLGGFSAEQGIEVKRWLLDLESGGLRGAEHMRTSFLKHTVSL